MGHNSGCYERSWVDQVTDDDTLLLVELDSERKMDIQRFKGLEEFKTSQHCRRRSWVHVDLTKWKLAECVETD